MNSVRVLALGSLLVAVPTAHLQAATPVVHQCEVLVIGGSAGGVAAAIAAAELGAQTCLVESTPWLGGQFLTVPALDEPTWHPDNYSGTNDSLEWPPSRPFSASYRALREWLQEQAAGDYNYDFPTCGLSGSQFTDLFDPGNNTTNPFGIGYEPRWAKGWIETRLFNLGVDVTTEATVTQKLTNQDETHVTGAIAVRNNVPHVFNAQMTIDATEWGDFLPLDPLIPYWVGVDKKEDTGEAHAPLVADPLCVNPITYTFFMEKPPSGGPIINPAPSPYNPSFYSLGHPNTYPDEGLGCSKPSTGTFWNWRRLHAPLQFISPGNETTQINTPTVDSASPPAIGGNDYNRFCLEAYTNPFVGCEVIEGPNRQAKLDRAKLLSRGFAYWIQTQLAQTPGGGSTLWPMAGNVTLTAFGVNDGFAPIPYVRESRRIKAIKTIVEEDISHSLAPSGSPPRARQFLDSVGIGHYHMDLHDCAPGEPFRDFNPIPLASLPYQVPLGAMIPQLGEDVPAEGFLASSKNIGVTHITNGAYRLHPSEWHVGLASGAAAAVSVQENTTPRFMATGHEPQFGQATRPHVRAMRVLQQKLVRNLRSPLYWWGDVWDPYPLDPTPLPEETLFEATQMVAADEIMLGAPGTGLRFDPAGTITRGIGALIIMRAIHTKTPVDTTCIGTAFLDVPCPGAGTPTPWGGHYPYVQALKNDNALTTSQTFSPPACAPSSTYFRPDCPLKRRDWIRFLVLAKGIPINLNPTEHYSDVRPGDPDFAYIDAAWTAGLVDVTSGQFRPNATLVRSEAAIMSYNSIRQYYDLD